MTGTAVVLAGFAARVFAVEGPAKLTGYLEEVYRSHVAGEDVSGKIARARRTSRAAAEPFPVIVLTDGPASNFAERAEELGASVRWALGSSLYCVINAETLGRFVSEPWAILVAPPPEPHPETVLTTVLTEGDQKANAREYREFNPPYTGQGVKVGVIDGDYKGLSNRIKDGELPEGLQQWVCDQNGCGSGTVGSEMPENENRCLGYGHGVACAEIIHDMAPGAELHLVLLKDGNLPDALRWLKKEGVRVVSISMGWAPNLGPLDGRDVASFNDSIREAFGQDEQRPDKRILTVVAAGNNRLLHYQGQFNPTKEKEPKHVFASRWFGIRQDTTLGFTVRSTTCERDARVLFFLSWNEWHRQKLEATAAQSDYDLEIACPNQNQGRSIPECKPDSQGNLQERPCIAYSSQGFCKRDIQRGQQGALPCETVAYYYPHNSSDNACELTIVRKDDGKQNHSLSLTAWGPVVFNEHRVYEGSLSIPADSPEALAVGAVDVSEETPEKYSSQGPTSDGRVKPDIAAFARVSTATYGPRGFWKELLDWLLGLWRFTGTSAAAPHVAGAAALLLSQNPNLSPEQITHILLESAKPLGKRRPNNRVGYGILRLPPLDDPILNIVKPTAVEPAYVGPPAAPMKTSALLSLRTKGGTFLGGLKRENFRVMVGQHEAVVSALLQTSDSYVIGFVPPSQVAPGVFDLTITATPTGPAERWSALDRKRNAVVYGADVQRAVDVILVIDRSGSMEGEAIAAAKDAAKLFIDLMADGDRVGVVSYSTGARIDYSLTTIVPTSQPRVIWFDDGENGPGAWEAEPPWSLTEEASNSPTHAWSDSPYGPYGNDANVSLQTVSPISLEGLSNPELAFYTMTDLESGWDFGLVEISGDGGQRWVEVASLTGERPAWQEHRISLDRFRGRTILIRFRLRTDFSVTGDGWYIDDVVVREKVRDVRHEARSAIDGLVAYGGTSMAQGCARQ